MKKHQLTKKELDNVLNLSNFIAQKEDEYKRVLDALNLQFKMMIASDILPRLKIDISLLDKCLVDIQEGILIIKEEEDNKEKKQEVQKSQ